MKNKLFVLGLVVLGLAGFLFLKFQKQQETKNLPVQTAGSALNFVRPHSPAFGNAMGRAVVVEWFDPECESCRAIHPAFKKIVQDYKDRVHFVLRYMPYHGNSMFAATALEEAKEFGKFEEALDVLFENQPLWGDHHQPRPELIVKLLSDLGIPKERLNRDYLLKKHGEKINLDEADGKVVGVRGTPSFFVNGVPLDQLGEEQLRSAIEAAIR